MNLGSAFPGQFLEIEKVKNEFCGVSIGLEKRVLILSVFLESENQILVHLLLMFFLQFLEKVKVENEFCRVFISLENSNSLTG